MSSSHPPDSIQPKGFPGEHEIKKWVREAVKPLVERVQTVVDGIESTVHKVEQPIESLGKRYLDDIPGDVARFGDLAQSQVIYLKRLQKSFSSAYSLLDDELTFDRDKGIKLREDLGTLVDEIGPLFESLGQKFALDDGPEKAFERFTVILPHIPDEILGSLSVLAELVSFDSLVKALGRVDRALGSDPFAPVPETGSDAQRAVLGGIVVMSLFANALEYVISLCPLTVSVSGEGGASVGAQAEVGAEVGLVALVPAVLGLLVLPMRVGIDALSGYLNIIS